MFHFLCKGTDACQRDSGGNLYWTYSSRQYTVGIVSYGKDCASKYPSVNTRVTFYLNWIEQQLPGLFFCKKWENSKLSIINMCENFKRLKLFNVQESFQNLFNTITYWTLKPSEILCLECLRVLHWMLFTLIIQFKFTNFSYEKQVGLGKKKKIYFNFLKFRYRFF